MVHLSIFPFIVCKRGKSQRSTKDSTDPNLRTAAINNHSTHLVEMRPLVEPVSEWESCTFICFKLQLVRVFNNAAQFTRPWFNRTRPVAKSPRVAEHTHSATLTFTHSPRPHCETVRCSSWFFVLF
ncbi:hypothetical protein TNCV_830501 [Trichonephila clavipes]|nr:hypothetical protein TNCV_830501 [Trichonephila clavipes]